MRLKTKLVLAITALVFVTAALLSIVYVSQLLHAAVQDAYEANHVVASQVRMALQDTLEAGLKDRKVNPNKPEELHELTASVVRSSDSLQAVIESVNRYSLTVYDINIGDSSNSVLLSTDPENEDKQLPQRPEYRDLLHANSFRLMREVFGQPRVLDVSDTIESNGKLFASVHVGVRTTFLRAVYQPWLVEAVTLMSLVLVTALVAAFLLGNLALRPLEEISRQLDYWTRQSASAESDVRGKKLPLQDTAALVSNKIENLGQRMRNVEEVFSALSSNLDQILGNLQDGILLFSADGRAVLVSEAARRFLGIGHEPVLGKTSEAIFNPATALGQTLGDAYRQRSPISNVEICTENGRRILASLEFINDSDTHQGLGALMTLHDLESVEAIGSELEISRRMAAIGRLTSGVGHEVKNPINAIVVHLELLKNKLVDGPAPAQRHLDVIESEIHRLDRVVQTLVDFSRPVELRLREQDLVSVVEEVFALAVDEMRLRGVELHKQMPAKPVIVNVDTDLFKQALLNVLQNGAHAMPEGGRLTVELTEESGNALLRVIDQGPGIPEELRERIFDLYFTTKTEGSGIGLAMTYRILQFHHGSIEVQSKEGAGAEFDLKIPLLVAEGSRRHHDRRA